LISAESGIMMGRKAAYVPVKGLVSSAPLADMKARERFSCDERSAAIRQAAAELFLKHGFSRVSVDVIIARSGGSKRELYAQFDSKEGLFRHVIGDICEEVLEPLGRLLAEDTDVANSLRAMSRAFLDFMLSPRVVALQRLVMSECLNFPDFAKDFYHRGPAALHKVVADFLEKRSAAGEIQIDNARMSAALFTDMLAIDLQFRTMAGIPFSDAEIDMRVAEAVRIFTNGVHPGSTSSVA
jgi:AcrR family transcriptional regulator